MTTVLADQFELDYGTIEETAKELYIRALKILPPQVKRGFERLQRDETDGTAKTILGTMVENIAVAERTRNLLCQDTGIPIYNVVVGRDVRLDGVALKQALRRGAERATREHPLRSSVVHPITRINEQTSCGRGIPVINVDFDDSARQIRIEMIPKGSGSENGSFLQMLIPAQGIDGIKTFVIEGEARLDTFLRWTDNPLTKAAEFGLVFLLAAHLAGGVRLLLIEFVGWRDWQSRAIAFAFTLGLVFGLLFLLKFGA
jgi:tartrate dehydratase alpha subunit/fumarate hydratase class I-like protein